MGMTRKQLLNGTAATLGAAGLAGCTPLVNRFATPELPAALPDAGGDPYLRRALNRIAFGPRPEDLIRVGEIGLNAYVEEQLA
ncbi:MAG: DUF1800 domain-containing protein, partial [Armatimonadetes bacterium]|nr:DUF1800 domain-containing protein [Armatimonadota bacterium]